MIIITKFNKAIIDSKLYCMLQTTNHLEMPGKSSFLIPLMCKLLPLCTMTKSNSVSHLANMLEIYDYGTWVSRMAITLIRPTRKHDAIHEIRST